MLKKKRVKEIILTYKKFFKGIGKFLKFLKPYRKYGYFAAFFMAITVLLELPMPFLTMYLIDNIIPKKNLRLLNIIAILLLFVLLVRALVQFLYRLNLVKYKVHVIYDVRKKLLRKIVSLPYMKLKTISPGYMVSRIDGDVDQLEGLMAETFINILKDLITFFVGMGILFFLNFKMALSALLLLPFFVYTMHHYGVKLNKLTEVLRERWANFTKVIEEVIEGIFSLKGRGRERWGEYRFGDKHVEALKQDSKTEITGSLAGIVLDIVGALSPLVILWLGIREIVLGNLTLGEFFAFNSFLTYLYGPISSLVSTNVDIHTTLASSERVFEILNWEGERVGGKKLNRIEGNIRFKNVRFRYGDDAEFYFDFEVKRGEKVAIVGESGSGKSTILKLLMGFLDGYSGEIFIDGIPLKEIDLREFRKRVGYVGGENFIFSGTIFENISLYISGDENRVRRSIQISDSEKFIRELEMGLYTEIGRNGRKLSTGETQRILISRALYENPDLILLDEATSGVDLKSEKYIYGRIMEEFSDRTVIFVNHRVESVRDFDRIFFVESGRIVEKGNFEKLLDLKGKFYGFYVTQKRKLEGLKVK